MKTPNPNCAGYYISSAKLISANHKQSTKQISYYLLGIVLFLVTISESATAQCSMNYGWYYPSTTPATHSSSTSSGTDYRTYGFYLYNGVSYVFSTCSNGGSYSGDSRMVLYNNSCGSLANVDDYCGTGPQISYTATYTGYYYLTLQHYNQGSAVSWTIAWWQVGCTTAGSPLSLSGSATGTTTASLSWSANGGSPAPTYYWNLYTSGGSSVTSGNTTGTSASVTGLSANSSYYFTVYANNSCGNSGTSTSSNFTTYPDAPTSISGTSTICNGISTTLTANGNQGTVYWYTGGCGSSQIGTGNSITVSPSSGTTYYARNYNGNWSTSCATVTVTVNSLPAISSHPATSAQNICINGTSTALSVTASGTGISYQWYKNTTASNSGGSPISGATSASYTPPTNTAGVSYYYCKVTGTCSPVVTSNVSGAITISAAAVGGSISGGGSVCTGTNSTSLTLSGHTGTINKWQYSTVSNFSSGVTDVANTSTTLTVTNLTATRYYRAYLVSGSCNAYSGTATITVNSLPAVASITGTTSFCVAAGTTLSNATAGGTWSSSNTGVATINSSGAVTGIAAGSSTISYTVTNGNGCSGTSTVAITVNPVLSAPGTVTATPSTIASGGSSNLNATSTGNAISWYTSASGGSPIGNTGSGVNFNVTPSVTTTYYAEASPASDNTLAAILTKLNANYSNITSQIPGRYTFAMDGSGGVNATSINDGGNDMYDGGNFISTNVTSNISYTDNTITNSTSFGTGGKYFTRYVSGLFVLAADIKNVSSFKVNGNYGSDGGGSTDAGSFSITVGGKTFNCFVSRVYNAGDPSINELFIIPSNPAASQTAIGNTGDSYHQLNGITESTRMYYLLYAGSSGGYINNTAAQNIATAFLTQTEAVIAGTVACASTSRTPVTVTVTFAPTVTTDAISGIGTVSATGGGNVTNNGGLSITARGVCWGTTASPTTANNKTTDGTGTGTFVSAITGLTPGSTYYVRAYATNTNGTSYGSQVSFTAYAPGTIGGNQTICAGATPALLSSTAAATGMPSVIYQWQSSTDNVNFSDIAGATSTTYQPAAVNEVTYYRRNAISGASTVSSNTVTINLDAGLAAPTSGSATPSTILSGQNSVIKASTTAGNEIKWYTASTGGTLVATTASGANLTVSPASTTTYYAQAAPIACSDNTLANILSNLNSNYGNIISQIPGRYNFSMDGSGGVNASSINDGGNDMYDGGNYISTNFASSFSYNDNGVLTSTRFGTNGKYFTRYVSGLFVLAADLDNVSWFKVNGNYGSDGGGSTDGSTFTITVGCKTFNCFVSRVYNAGDPSINELFIIPANPAASHTSIGNTGDSYHQLNNIQASTRMYYLLYAGSSGGYINNSSAQTIATAFLNQTQSVISGSGSCPSLTRTAVTVNVSAAPTITTTSVSSITSNSGNSGGTISSDNGSAVTARGVCWNTSANPTIANNKTTDGTGTGAFTSAISGLTTGTTYYVRAYATNAMGTSYGNQVTLTPFQIGSLSTMNKVYGDAPFTLVNPTSSSNGSFSYTSSNTSVATISGNTVTILAAGTSTITATQAASGGYSSSSTTALLTVSKASQTITLSPLPTSVPLNQFVGNLLITASSSSGLPVTVTLGAGSAATLLYENGNYYLTSIEQTGTVTIIATQAGNDNYNTATVTQSFDVTKGNQTISFDALADATYTPSLTVTLSATASSELPVSFAVTSGPATLANGNELTITGAGTVTVLASQSGDNSWNPATSVSRTLSVAKATPSIDNFNDISKIFGDPDFTLSASSASTGAFSYSSSNSSVATVSGNTVSITGQGTTTLTVNQAMDNNYLAASTTATLTVGKASQQVSFAPIADITLPAFDGTPIQLNASSSSGLSVTYTVSVGSVATVNASNELVSTGATGNITVTATQSGNDNYEAADSTISFAVTKANQTISFAELISKNVGDADFDLEASSSSNLLISYSSSNTNVATVSGKTVTIVGVGTTTITASQSGNTYYNAATNVTQDLVVNKGTPVITDFSDLTKQYGNAPFTVNASSASTGAFTYSSSNTAVATVSGNTITITGSGTSTLTASQAADANYNSGSATLLLTVNKGTQTISFSALDDVYVGGSNFTLNATSSAGLAITYTSSNTTVATVSGNTVTIIGVGSTTITASQTGNSNYEAATAVEQVQKVLAAPDIVWTGALSTAWNTAGNWNPSGVPASGANITIPGSLSNYPVLNISPTIGNLSIADNASLSINGYTLTINGLLNGNGILKGSASSNLIIGGSGAGGTLYFDQTVPGTSNALNQLTLNRSSAGTADLGTNLEIKGTITLTQGTLSSGGNQITISGTTINRNGSSQTGAIDCSNQSSAVVLSGAAGQLIPAEAFTGVIENLTVNNAAGVQFSEPKTVNRLTLTSGIVTIGNNTLIASSISGGSSTSYIKTNGSGSVKTLIGLGETLVIPVGNTAYNPVAITNNTGAADSFGIRVQDEVYANAVSGNTVPYNRVQRTWHISKTNPNAGSGINLQFNWNAGELSGAITTASLFHYNGTRWVKQAAGSTYSTSTSLNFNGYLGGFSPFAVVEDLFTLPVSWLSFTAEKSNKQVLLKWSTATETSTKDFIIQHSTDGISWKMAGVVNAAGNSNSVRTYSFLHGNPVSGKNYYRLIQRDENGNSTYSKTLMLDINNSPEAVQLLGNPVTNGQLVLQVNKATSIGLYNNLGQLILTKQVAEGLQQINISSLAQGMYLIRYENKSIPLIKE